MKMCRFIVLVLISTQALGVNSFNSFEETYQKAVDGDPQAQYKIATMFYWGKGIDKNNQEAFKWYKKAAEQDLADAQYELGGMYHTGEGTERDYFEAAKWYRKAAEQGYAPAQKIGSVLNLW